MTLRPCPIELVLAADARGAGLRPSADAHLFRVRPGVYAPADQWRALAPWDRYLARVHAYALVSPGAVFAHESAAALLGLPVFGEPRRIHVFSTRRDHSVGYGDVVVHTSRDGRRIRRGALAVTDPAETAVDLSRTLPPAHALAVVDAAIAARAPFTTLDEIVRIASRQVNRRGQARLAWVTASADARSESVAESVSRAVIAWWGFEAPDLQEEFLLEGRRDRVDFFWRRRRIIGEADGYGKYGSTPDDVKASLIQEKVREDRLRRHVEGFVRWDFSDALHAIPLRDKLLHAGIRLVRPPRYAMLRTLPRFPRA